METLDSAAPAQVAAARHAFVERGHNGDGRPQTFVQCSLVLRRRGWDRAFDQRAKHMAQTSGDCLGKNRTRLLANGGTRGDGISECGAWRCVLG